MTCLHKFLEITPLPEVIDPFSTFLGGCNSEQLSGGNCLEYIISLENCIGLIQRHFGEATMSNETHGPEPPENIGVFICR